MTQTRIHTLDPELVDKDTLNYAYQYGVYLQRDFAPSDFQGQNEVGLLEAAYAYLDAYIGTSEVLKALQDNLDMDKPLTFVQAATVLNYMMDDARERLSLKLQEHPVVRPETVPDLPPATQKQMDEFEQRYRETFGDVA